MNQRSKIAVTSIIIAGGVAFFLFAPVVYWFSYDASGAIGLRILSNGTAVQTNPPQQSVYRSLGCVTIGLGDTYGEEAIVSNGQTIQSSFQLSCNRPIVPL